MFVAKRMTPNPVTISPTATVADAFEIMRSHKFRRLPVVDKGRLVGIVTDRDLREVSPSPATTLSIFELNYLLAKMQVKEVMRTNVITIRDDATIEEAALLMYNNKIGGLVVVNAAGAVVGIITETDIFKTFVDVMGLPEGKVRLTINVTDTVGVIHDITEVFKELGINISSLACYKNGDDKAELVIRADVRDVTELTARLAKIGFTVAHVAQIG
ncbi:CBS domain-containing protein [Sporolituus thermophilus]|uniref:Acetoin utilization protein AcuB n=1 Tax=Sporolituus thermophilus DSM 23256 TaxID=1123285 RepID=A0A1G7L1U9_9FIRM|nr:CBS and ACT domain-containing protein [Sporolituus thermophilus]SDF43458.1 acetoin utilization protein AcuB [Sporolituus thermophilus DSM 23256]